MIALTCMVYASQGMSLYYYKASGNDNWSTTSVWYENSSHTTPHNAVPTSSDNVFITNTSGSGQLSIIAPATCNNLDMTGFGGMFILTSADVTVLGNLTLSASGSFNAISNVFVMTASSGTKTITTNGKIIPLTINGAGTFQLLDNASFLQLTVTTGTFDLNGKTLIMNAATFDCNNSNTKTLKLGSGTITFTTGRLQIDLTNTTITANTATITISDAGALYVAGTNAQTLCSTLNISGNSANMNTTTYTIVGTLNLTSNAIIDTRISFNTNSTPYIAAPYDHTGITVTTALTIAGNSPTNRLLLQSQIPQRTFTFMFDGVPSISNVTFYNVAAVGVGGNIPWSGTSIGNYGLNTGITFTSPVIRYWIGNTGNWAGTSNWATSSNGSGGASEPLPQDSIVFDRFSFTTGGQTLNINRRFISGFTLENINLTYKPIVANTTTEGGIILTKSLDLRNAVSITANTALGYYIVSSTVHYYLPAATSLGNQMVIYGSNGVFSLHNDLTLTGAFTIYDGVINTNDYNITCSTFTCTGGWTTTTLNFSASIITMTGTANSTLTLPVLGVTMNLSGSTFKFTGVPAGSNTLYFRSYSFGKIWFPTYSSTNYWIVDASVTVGELRLETGAKVKLTSGITVTAGKLVANGIAGTQTYIASTASSATTISVSSGTMYLDYLNLTYVNATGGAKFCSGAHSTLSNSTGWSTNCFLNSLFINPSN